MQYKIQPVFLRRNDLKPEYNITRHTSYVLEATDPTFPKRREIAPGVTGWLRSELDSWAALRPVITKEEIRKQTPVCVGDSGVRK